jgi:hypothetical protein
VAKIDLVREGNEREGHQVMNETADQRTKRHIKALRAAHHFLKAAGAPWELIEPLYEIFFDMIDAVGKDLEAHHIGASRSCLR